MAIFQILLGLAVLTLGRRLFWLFVGAVGFLVGIQFAEQFLYGQPHWVVLITASAAGLVGALIAIFLQRLAVGLAGFMAGGYISVGIMNATGWQAQHLAWLIFLLGGLIGAVLLLVLFKWALIVLSALTGSMLIIQTLQFNPALSTMLFVALLAVGIGIQASLLSDKPPPAAPQA